MRSLLLLPVIVATATAQSPQTRTFGKPDAEFADPFSQINALRELRDGRVIVSDSRDKTLQVISFGGGKATAVGRAGSGPQEWSMPGRLMPFTADSTLMNDGMNSRFFVIDPDGKPARTFSPMADAVSGGSQAAPQGAVSIGGGTFTRSAGGGMDMGGRLLLGARGLDNKGRFYFQGIGLSISPTGGISSPDTLPLMRSDITGKKQDTLAWLHQVSMTSPGPSSGGAMTFSRMVPPFLAADDWAVFADGHVAIARATSYRVDVISPDGKLIQGPPVNYTPVRVTDADKEEWRKRLSGATQSVGFGGAGGTPTTRTNVPIPEPSSWPETKSPFQTGSVFAAPNGDLWVFRSRSATDLVPTADVFNAQGKLVGKVVLPQRTKLIGFGAKAVYLVRTDDDDLQYLQRHAVQWEGCAPELRDVCAK